MGALACGLEKGTLPGEATSTPLRKTWGMEHPEQSRPAAGSAHLALGTQAFWKTMSREQVGGSGRQDTRDKERRKEFTGVGGGVGGG